MRREVDPSRVLQFMERVGAVARGPMRVYFTGGATAVLLGWRGRSQWIATKGLAEFYHYDFYAQALSKLERDHTRDRSDVRSMLEHGLSEEGRLLAFLDAIEEAFLRYPALDFAAFQGRARAFLRGEGRAP